MIRWLIIHNCGYATSATAGSEKLFDLDACSASSSNDQFHGNFVAPRCFRVALLPCSCCVDLKNILAVVTDLDAMSWDRSTKDNSEEIVFDRPLL